MSSSLSCRFLLAGHSVSSVVGALLCAGCSDEAERLSGGYLYRDEGVDTKELLANRAGMPSIHGRVVHYRYDANFIAVAQHPVYAEYRTAVGFSLRNDLQKYPTNSATDIVTSERIADSLLAHDRQYQAIFAHKMNYWLIVNQPGKVYGPLTYAQYVEQTQALRVPKELTLQAEPE